MEMVHPVSSTEVRFWQALTELLTEKEVTKISVAELCRKAGLSRKTFYARYQKIEDVLDSLLDSMTENTTSIGTLPNFGTDPSVIPTYIDEALKLPYTGPYTICIMFHNLNQTDHYKNIMAELLREDWEKHYAIKRDRLRLYAKAVTASLTQIYCDWSSMKRPLPSDELKEFVRLYLKGAFDTLKEMERPR